jgi:hypothetical protein
MILQFIRRDPAWKLAPWLTAAAAIAALFYSPRHPGSLIVGVGVPVYAVMFMRTLPHQRVTFFEAALPVSGRDLFLARLLSLLAMLWLPATATAAMLLLMGNPASTVSTVALIAIVMTLAMIVILSVQVKQFAAPAWLTVACSPFAALALALALSLGHPLPIAGAYAAAAITIAAIAWKAVPEAFQSAPVAVSAPRKKTGNAAPSIPWWPVIRSLFPWQIAIFVPIGILWAASGPFIYAPMYLCSGYSAAKSGSRWTLALPISRRLMLAAAALPMLLVLAAGSIIGAVTGVAQTYRDPVRLGDVHDSRPASPRDVVVDLAFWLPAPGGRVPVVAAPWGETFQPPPFRFLGLTFYNPYAVGEKNSRQYEQWQLARATTYIYGRPVAPRDLKNARKAGLRSITLGPRMRILNLAAILAMGLFWIWVTELGSWHWLGRLSSALRHTLTFSLVLIPVAALLGADLLIGKTPGMVSQSLLEGGLLFVSRHLPQNLAIVAVAAALPLAPLWWIVDRQAAVSEMSQRIQTLFDRARV